MSYIKALSCSDPTWLDPLRPVKAPFDDPRRAPGHVLGNGVRFGDSSDIRAAGEGVETMPRAQIRACRCCPWSPGFRPTISPPSNCPLPCAVSMSPATTMRPV
jgi:hypothetical protein